MYVLRIVEGGAAEVHVATGSTAAEAVRRHFEDLAAFSSPPSGTLGWLGIEAMRFADDRLEAFDEAVDAEERADVLERVLRAGAPQETIRLRARLAGGEVEVSEG